MEQMNRKAARKGKGAARKKAKGAAKKKAAARKATRAAAAFKRRVGGAKKTVTLTVARGPVSPAAREIIRSISATLDLALRRLADR